MNVYDKYLGYEDGHYFRKEAEDMLNKFNSDAYVENGVVRWMSNDFVPPKDIIEFWSNNGKQFDYQKSLQALEEQTLAVIRQYKESNSNRRYSEEELFEMRAAYGVGATVVDVCTGRKIKL